MQSLADKYAPKTLNDLLINDNIKNTLQDFIDKKTIQSLLLSGKQGIGKSTLAEILVTSLDSTFLYINCGLDGKVDTMRTKVREFCDSVAINNDVPKIVILDEADALSSVGESDDSSTGKSTAQGSLRNLIDQSSDDTRFILTCNYPSKIIGPLKSRCTPIALSTSIEEILKRCIYILKTEKIIFDKNILKIFINDVIKKKFPDIRTIINILEQWSVSGTLKPVVVEDKNDLDEFIYKLIEMLLMSGLKETRKWYLNKEELFNNDYIKLSSALFDNLMGDEQKQEIVADSLRHQSHVLDNEVEFCNMLIKIKKTVKKNDK